MKGKVKFFNLMKGFGFITAEDKEYFFHISDVEGQQIQKDDEVEFATASDPKGEKAVKVKVLE